MRHIIFYRLMTEIFTSSSEAETIEIAKKCARTLAPGSRICLTGELGSGKTVFMRGLTEYYSCSGQLSSPTFSLLNIYQGSFHGEPVTLHHFDLYRLRSAEELDAIGFDEFVSDASLSVVEWGERFFDYYSNYNALVTFAYDGLSRRGITVAWRES